MVDLKQHPYGKLFTLPDEENLLQLSLDIRKNGLNNPIVLLDGKVLDGWCRYLVCDLACIEPEFGEYGGNDPLGYVVSQNLCRRHLDKSQRAAIAAELSNLEKGQRADEMGKSQIGKFTHLKPTTQPEAADLLKVSTSLVKHGKQILRDAPEKFEEVKRGDKTVHKALQEIKEDQKKPLSGVTVKNRRGKNAPTGRQNAFRIANAAIKKLREIPGDEPSRQDALQFVVVWIDNNNFSGSGSAAG